MPQSITTVGISVAFNGEFTCHVGIERGSVGGKLADAVRERVAVRPDAMVDCQVVRRAVSTNVLPRRCAGIMDTRTYVVDCVPMDGKTVGNIVGGSIVGSGAHTTNRLPKPGDPHRSEACAGR